MKIKQLDVAGFRSLKNVSWQPGDLNVVIGPNGTGKSNLLRALELLSASAQGSLSKHILSVGGMGAIVWDGASPSIHLGLKTSSPENDYDIELARLGLTSSGVVQREVFSSKPLGKSDLQPPVIKHIERTNLQFDYAETLVNSLGYIPQEETLLSFPFIPTISNAATQKLRNYLSKLAIHHDLNVSQSSKIRQAVIARSERQIEPDGQNLVEVLHTLYVGNRDFERDVDLAMRAAFGSVYEKLVIPPDADHRVQLRIRWKTLNRDSHASELSDGTLRFLLLIAILATPDPPSLIAIDEPETGLHPSMFPIIAEYAVEASTRTQVVFTTHSPQLLSAFGKNRVTTTITGWENGETSLHTLDGEQLDYWLEDYSLGSLFESGQLEAMA